MSKQLCTCTTNIINLNRLFFIIVLSVLAVTNVYAQKTTDDKLAMQFYEQKQFDKASSYFEKLYDKQPDA